MTRFRVDFKLIGDFFVEFDAENAEEALELSQTIAHEKMMTGETFQKHCVLFMGQEALEVEPDAEPPPPVLN